MKDLGSFLRASPERTVGVDFLKSLTTSNESIGEVLRQRFRMTTVAQLMKEVESAPRAENNLDGSRLFSDPHDRPAISFDDL